MTKYARSEIQWFAREMEKKLRANDHKGGWQDESFPYLFNRLVEEVDELKKYCNVFGGRKGIREAADVANFAMMIADHLQRSLKTFPKSTKSPAPST